MWVSADGIKKEFAEGMRYYELAAAYQPLYENDILLAVRDGKLFELQERCTLPQAEHRRSVFAQCDVKCGAMAEPPALSAKDADTCVCAPENADGAQLGTEEKPLSLHFVTAAEKVGRMTYERSCIFMMLKAFYSVCREVPDFEVIIDYTIGGGFYGYLKGAAALTDELLSRVKKEMRRMQAARMPITKRSVQTDEAVELFHRRGMHDKERLFHYRRTSRVNLYALDGFEDYFYGYMVHDTGYLKYFDLQRYQNGFVLLMPNEAAPKQVAAFRPLDKLYAVQYRSSLWAEQLGVGDVGKLNDWIADGKADELMLMQEAIFEKEIGNIANRIMQEGRQLVMIAGPSSSGKTTFSHRLSIQLRALGLHPHPIAVDNYFLSRKDAPRDADGNYDFESIRCLDVEQFNADMTKLLAGARVQLPRFNFFTGEREYKGDFLQLGAQDILVIEGIHCLNDAMSYALPKEKKFRIYISALTQINIDKHNRIPTTDLRLLRRMVRDSRTRGYTAEETIGMWKNVRRGEDENIFPYQESADVMVNSAMIYELPILKIYAEPLLFRIAKTSPAYQEAKRLLKFLDYFLALSPEPIPKNSIVREFIGGSCLDVG